MRVIDQSTREAMLSIQQLIADYWDEVDVARGLNATDYYVDDCSFDPGMGTIFSGHDGVRSFYAKRAARGARTTRHVSHNLRIQLEAPDHARATYIMAFYGADGSAPVEDYEGPDVISDVECRVRCDQSGRWRFSSMEGRAIFVGTEPYTRGGIVGAR